MSNNYTDFMDFLLEETMRNKGTDLHLCAGSKPLMRVNSVLIEVEGTEKLTPDVIVNFVEDYLGDENLVLLKKNKSIDISYSKRNLGRFRCNVYYQRGTYAMAIRALPIEIPEFGTLKLPDVIRSFTEKTKGLVLITGATGSGKSTTLASMIDLINQNHKYHIITIEDPLEYLHRHKNSMVTQREIGEDALDFSSSLKAALREDPDVIMVGEMRDMETISIALTAAETGHLVLSTLHTSSAVKAIDRMVDAFSREQQNQVRSQLATVLEGIISQQLVPQKDGKGLRAVSEVMIANTAVRNLIREGKHYQINNLIQTGSKIGMVSMERHLAELVKEGVISEELGRIRASDSTIFENYMKNGGI